MKAAILTVGTEILFGQVVNTNAAWLSRKLNDLGIDVMYHYTVGDNSDRLSIMIKDIFETCDLIITTGGLGPTEDDLTKETVCEVMGDELVLHQPSLESLKEYERKQGTKITENNYKQAMMPSRATVFDNQAGTAPAMALSIDGKTAVCLPGPPREMKWVFENRVRDYLANMSDKVIHYRQIRLFGLGESTLETKLLPLIDVQTDPTIATYAKEGECAVRIASKRDTLDEAVRAVDEMCAKVNELVGDYIYSFDDEEFKDVVGNILIEKNISLASAESLTGGLFAKTITDVPGISAVFDRGIVTYTNRAKMDELGVKEETLERFGAVSEQTAAEMAAGLHEKTGCDICVSATGIAGPSGGTPEKPVGLVYMGIWHDGICEVRKIIEPQASRNVIRNYAMLNMLDMIYKAVR